MRRWGWRLFLAVVAMALSAVPPSAQKRAVSVALIEMPYVGERNVPELSPGPGNLVAGGLAASLAAAGARVKPVNTARLAATEEREYGAWHRLALANGRLADLVAGSLREGDLAVGLLANCSSLLGMLGGVQQSGEGGKPLRVGLVYIDAHGDFNTPETTLSGMLGGMDVAAAAGLCLTNLRRTSKLDPPLAMPDIVLAGVRDTDPLEQELIDRSNVARLSVDDLRSAARQAGGLPGTSPLRRVLAELSRHVDRVYVHVDMDVLDPREVTGHSLAVPNGPTSAELALAVAEMFKDPKAVAFGVASTPTGDRDKGGLSVKAAYELIRAAVRGAGDRGELIQ